MNVRMDRRTLLKAAVLAWDGQPKASPPKPINMALARYRDRWLHHPCIGDPSWDTFVREPGNPIYTGKPPYEWPVNGTLFRDPKSGRWYVYASVYPRGYWGQPGANTLVLREKTDGGWEALDLAFEGDPQAFYGDGSRTGPTTDAFVVFWEGAYYALIGWANPSNTRGGLALAKASRPEGPFTILAPPIHDDAKQKPILGRYVRAYASTLVRRKHDWLIIHMMSTPRNSGGTWGLFAMVSPSLEGPYSEPIALLLPQSDRFHPPLAEFFPAYVHGRRIYAPATSVARNRTFQSVFSAPVEEAHRPEAWRPEQIGSVWHAEPVANEDQGIWGQTFAAQVTPNATLRAMFPSKTREDIGTINMAWRPMTKLYRDGFVLSAPNAPSRAVLRGEVADFLLHTRVHSHGPWALAWQCRDPLGPDQPSADAVSHPLSRTDRLELRLENGRWAIVRLIPQHRDRPVASGIIETQNPPIEIHAQGASCRVSLAGTVVWEGATEERPCRMEILAETGTILRVEEFRLNGPVAASFEAWLATEALAGAGSLPGEWTAVEHPEFRYGQGYVSAKPGARAKWNYAGAGFRLWAPSRKGYGSCSVKVDGRHLATLDLGAGPPHPSQPVLAQELPIGLHAVVVEALGEGVPLDILEVRTA